MNNNQKISRRGHRPLRGFALLVAMLVLPLAACDVDELLEVEEPEFPNLSQIQDLNLLFNSALAEFQDAYSGTGGDAWLSVSGLMTDELQSTGSFTTRRATDRRSSQPISNGNTSDGAFNDLHQARVIAETALDLFAEQAPTDSRVAELNARLGYIYTVLAEGWCGALPFSEFELATATVVEFGAPQTSVATLNEAIGFFDAALAVDPGNNIAKVGKARALLSLGEIQAAAAAVADVPTDFVAKVEHSTNSGRQNNPVFSLMANGRYSFDHGADGEGINGVPFRGLADPRVPWRFLRFGFSAGNVFLSQRFQNLDADVAFSDGVEARLIEAEADLMAAPADPANTEWLDILNDLRANVAVHMPNLFDDYALVLPNHPQGNVRNPDELEPLTDPGTAEERIDMLFQERAIWLLHTGRRMGDMRRLLRAPYNRDAEDVFPTGAWFRGGPYGDEVAFPLTFREVANNPNIEESQCVVTQDGSFTG